MAAASARIGPSARSSAATSRASSEVSDSCTTAARRARQVAIRCAAAPEGFRRVTRVQGVARADEQARACQSTDQRAHRVAGQPEPVGDLGDRLVRVTHDAQEQIHLGAGQGPSLPRAGRPPARRHGSGHVRSRQGSGEPVDLTLPSRSAPAGDLDTRGHRTPRSGRGRGLIDHVRTLAPAHVRLRTETHGGSQVIPDITHLAGTRSAV